MQCARSTRITTHDPCRLLVTLMRACWWWGWRRACLPPQNKPVGSEVNECNAYLAAELATLAPDSVVLALGGVAHKAVIKALKLRQADYKFAHASNFPLPGDLRLLSSYHCSRYNTQTKRLTSAMFADVFGTARRHLDALDSKAAVA